MLRSRSEPVPYFLVGAGAGVKVRLRLTLDKTDEILNDILFVNSHIDKRQFKKRILINDIFLVRKKEWCLKNFSG